MGIHQEFMGRFDDPSGALLQTLAEEDIARNCRAAEQNRRNDELAEDKTQHATKKQQRDKSIFNYFFHVTDPPNKTTHENVH